MINKENSFLSIMAKKQRGWKEVIEKQWSIVNLLLVFYLCPSSLRLIENI